MMDLEDRIRLGYPLLPEHLESLAAAPLPELGRLANQVRERLHANLVYVRSAPEFTLEEVFPLDRRAWPERLVGIRQTARHQAILPLIEAAVTHTTGDAEIRLIALTRLALDTIPHVAVHWTRATEPVAQIALRFGADEIQGWPASLPHKELVRQIQEAGRELFPCDARYQPAPLASEILPVLNA
jgi:hypothetical protein